MAATWRPSRPRSSKNALKSDVPSTAKYTLEGVKVSLDLLRRAAVFVPVPYVRSAVEIAIGLIEIGENMQSSLQRVGDLNKRVWALMLVMIQPFRGKTIQDIPPRLQEDTERFATELQDIQRILKGIAAQNKIITLLFTRLNDEKVKDCVDRLDESMNKFQVSREINNAIIQWEMATGIKEGIKVSKQVLEVANGTLGITQRNHELTQETNLIAKDGLRVVEENLKTIAQLRDELRNTSKQTPHHASPLSSREMPTRPRFFYGRDGVVDDIVRVLLSEEHRHIALLGAGGMGKTSVAIVVMRHSSIIEKFGDRLFWVPCMEGRSPTRFLDILLSCLRITRDTGDPLSDILYELKASLDPRVILLDNFETPWNLEGYQSEIEQILCALAAFPHITLFITMRSKQPPSHNIQWHCPPMISLDIAEARRVYSAIYPHADSDPVLDELLAELGHMPLAITLMAQVGNKSGSTAGDLLQTWRKESVRTNMLESINVSIALSVRSPPMMAKPEAFTLLATLAMFPAGTQSKNLARWASSITDMPGALAALADASLADRDPRTMTFHVHPVIRSYMLHPLRLPVTVKVDVRAAIYRFLAEHKSEPGDPAFVNDARELANEETNIQSILLDAIKQGFHDNTADALITYCWYQHWTRPRLDVIKSVLAVSRSSKKVSYIAESLFCLGHMYSKLDDHDEAAATLSEAKNMFVAAGLTSKAARCSIKLVDVYMFLQNDDACRNAVEDAQHNLRQIGDEALVADVLLCIAQYNWFIRAHAEARESLAEAQQIYLRLNKQMGVAHCNYQISRTYYSQGNFAEARKAAEAAFEEYKQLDHRDSAAETLVHLGRILKDMECYDDAFRCILQVIRAYQDIGGRNGIAQGWEALGQTHSRVGQYDDARLAYEKALEIFRSIHGTLVRNYGMALCLYGIAETYRCQGRLEDEKRINVEYEDLELDVSNDRNYC